MRNSKQPIWEWLAEKIESDCVTFNTLRMSSGRPPFAFPVDVMRRMLILLRDAGRPVPDFHIVRNGDEPKLVLKWTRFGGEAFVSASRDDVIGMKVVVAGRILSHAKGTGDDGRVAEELPEDCILAQARAVPYAEFDPTPLLEALDHFTPLKQVIVVRRDLGMRQGKACSQSAHSSGEFMREQIVASLGDGRRLDFSDDEIEWMTVGMAKITVRSDSREQFDAIADDARAKGLKVRVITDSGRTEFGGVPTVTALAIGPTRSAYVDGITGGLTLL